MNLVEAVYRISAVFPKSETYGLTGQMRRAAISIPCNVAEGHTRSSTKEFLQYISMAQPSLAELETELELARRLDYAPSEELKPIFRDTALLGRKLYALRDALAKK